MPDEKQHWTESLLDTVKTQILELLDQEGLILSILFGGVAESCVGND